MNETISKSENTSVASLSNRFESIRQRTEAICKPLEIEDYVVQPVDYVSPPKWHLAHTTWFFETFFLKEVYRNYKPFHPDFNFLFNSYYETVGARVLRTDRGNITRPGVKQLMEYRNYVNSKVKEALEQETILPDLSAIIELGLQHEMQHQELLLSDLKYILGHNPIFPVYDPDNKIDRIKSSEKSDFISIDAGNYKIGFQGDGFSFDNELNRHTVYVHDFEIASEPVKFGDFIAFIEDGGYRRFEFWHSDAWAWVQENNITAPMYIHKENEKWMRYTLGGYKEVNPNEILVHVSYYEAAAFASWKKMRLPTEFEWEIASDKFSWGKVWEWTNSAYLPYPGFTKAPGALGEYNGKFMVNQMVLRGASTATTPGHSRKSYRNFFHPFLQWQYAGIRLAR